MKMNEQKINELNYKFKIRYNEILEEAPNLHDREYCRVLSKDTASEVFNTAFSNESTTQSLDLDSPVERFPVFEGLPGIGKSTGLMQITIPAITDILYAEKIISVFLVVIPDSVKVYGQMMSHLSLMGQRHLIKTITMGSKSEICEYSRIIRTQNSSFSMMHGQSVRGFVILTKQAMINGGTKAQKAKSYTKTGITEVLAQLRKENSNCEIVFTGMFDEVRVSSQIDELMTKYKSKNPIQKPISYMPALCDLINNAILPNVDKFTSIGYEGSPTYDLTSTAPLKSGAKLFGPVQDENYSVEVPYGGGTSIWYMKEVSEPIWKGANSLDLSYYSGMTTKKFDYWRELLTKMNNDTTDLNQYNVKMKKEIDSQLKKYGVGIYKSKRMGLIVSGSDDATKPGSRFVQGEKIKEFLLEQKTPHIFYTDNEDLCYWFDGKTQHNIPNDYSFSDWQTEIFDKIENGEVQLIVVKRKLLWGYDNNSIFGVAGTSEYTDMMPDHDTAKPLTGAKQSTTRGARVFTGLVDTDGNLIFLREAAELIDKIMHDENYELANKVIDLIATNNQFKAYQLEGKSDVHGQLHSWLEKKYPNKKEFIEVFNNYIVQEKDNFHPLKCTCAPCEIHDFKNQRISEEKVDKDMPEISKKLDDIVDVISNITPKINLDPDVPEQRI